MGRCFGDSVLDKFATNLPKAHKTAFLLLLLLSFFFFFVLLCRFFKLFFSPEARETSYQEKPVRNLLFTNRAFYTRCNFFLNYKKKKKKKKGLSYCEQGYLNIESKIIYFISSHNDKLKEKNNNKTS